ncbi:Membrane attack complex component/perforin (MACPF) [Gracilaria domingensis]|nr:Membrane attack complex component/perforin (MACPF) [Gracilaria domingensis]
MIGSTADLLRGLESEWSPTTGSWSITRPPLSIALRKIDLQPEGGRSAWGDLKVTLHDSPQDLLNNLMPCSVHQASDDTLSPKLYTGGMLLGPKNSQKARDDLGRTLGVPISEDYSYALAQFRRVDGHQYHPSRPNGIQKHQAEFLEETIDIAADQFKTDLRALPRKRGLRMTDQMAQLTMENAAVYLNFFKTWGTHFVSGVTFGDVIMQVFAYTEEKMSKIKLEFDVNSSNAQDFVYFTTSSEGKFGYVEHYGNILNLSNDPSFSQSLSRGDWVDNLWAVGHNNIFNTFLSSTVPTGLFDYVFRSQTEIHVEFSPLAVYCEFERSDLWQRILKAASATLFLDMIDPNLSSLEFPDFSKVLPNDQQGVVSHLPTKHINVYKARLELDAMKILERSVVDSFKACAYVASTRGNFEIPGDSFQVVAGIIDARNEGSASVLKLTDEAFKKYELACSEFTGILRIENASGSEHDTIADGLVYHVDSHDYPEITKDIRIAADMESLDLSGQKRNFHFALTFGSAVLATHAQHADEESEPEIYSVVRKFLHWLSRAITPKEVKSDLPKEEKAALEETEREMMEIRTRALRMSLFYADTSSGAFVPILPPEAYEDEVLAMTEAAKLMEVLITENLAQIAARKAHEAQIEASVDIKEDVQESGKLIAGFVKASAEKQAAIASSFDNLISAQEREVVRQQAIADRLSGELFTLRSKFDEAGQFLEKQIKILEKQQILQLALNFGASLFAAKTSIAIPANTITDLERFGKSAQRIQKMFNVLQSLQAVYNGVLPEARNISASHRVLAAMGTDSFGNVSVLPWDVVQIQFKSVIRKMPDDASLAVAKADLQLAFETLVLKAKTLMKTQSGIYQIQSKLYENHMQKELAKGQQQDLETLVSNFETSSITDFKVDDVDLVGMTSMLNFRRDQTMHLLAQVFLLQDQALHYEILHNLTLITDFSLLNFLLARSEQKNKVAHAKAILEHSQPVTTTPILYTVSNIPVSDFMDGKDKRIRISPNAPQFSQYSFVRVKALVLSVQGVGTSSDWSVRLRFDEAPFMDRDMQGHSWTFHTPERERIYEYNANNEPKFTDEGQSWSQNQSMVTPFGGWLVDFPVDTEFSGTEITLTLSFVLETRIRSDDLKFELETMKLAFLSAGEESKSGPDPVLIAGKPSDPLPSSKTGVPMVGVDLLPTSTDKPEIKEPTLISGPVLIGEIPASVPVSEPVLISSSTSSGKDKTGKGPSESDSDSSSSSDSDDSGSSSGGKKKKKKDKKKKKSKKSKKSKKKSKKSGSESDDDSKKSKKSESESGDGGPEDKTATTSTIQFTTRIPEMIPQTHPVSEKPLAPEPIVSEPSTITSVTKVQPAQVFSVTQFSAYTEESSRRPSKEDIISGAHNRTVTNGWDVIFNMSAPFINAALKEQFTELQKDVSFNNVINARPESKLGDSKTKTISLSNVFFGSPTVVDILDIVPAVCIPINQGNLVQSQQWGQSTPITEQADLSSKAIQIFVRTRRGNPARFVLGEGSFSFKDMSAQNGEYRFSEGLRVTESDMNTLFKEIKSYFSANDITLSLPLDLLYAETWDTDAMNAEFARQYNDVIMRASSANKIEASVSETKAAITSMTEIQLTYSYPSITFDHTDSEEVTVSMQILSGSATKFLRQGDDAPWKQSGETQSLQNATMTAIITVEKIMGTVTDSDSTDQVLDVILDMSSGSFNLSQVELSPVGNLSLSRTIKAHFAQNNVTYLINRLDLSEISVLPELTPSDFLLNVLVTPSNVEVLQLFIQTGSRPVKNHTQTFLDNLSEPIPLGYECSIIVRSELFFDSILPGSISNWSATGVGGDSTEKRAWKAKFIRAVVVSQHIDLSDLNRPELITFPSYGTRKFTYELKPRHLTWDLGSTSSESLTLTPTEDGALALAGTKNQNIHVEETSKDYFGVNSRGSNTSRRTITQTVQSVVAGTMRWKVDRGERDQKLKAEMDNEGLVVQATLTGGGSCGCDGMEARINQQVHSQLPGQIQSQLDVDVQPMSTFALKNLLFYRENYIDLKFAAVPGDLFIFGNFKELDT